MADQPAAFLKLCADKERFRWLEPPVTTHKINVLHPLAARTAADHAVAILEWAQAARQAWSLHHEQVQVGGTASPMSPNPSSKLTRCGRLTVTAYAGSLAQTSGTTPHWGWIGKGKCHDRRHLQNPASNCLWQAVV
jgi:hypothetical protein